jgi:hypothetical protein
MSDPTTVHAMDKLNERLFGVLIRVHVKGDADAVLTLPKRIKTGAEATMFLFNLGLKMSGIDPNVSFTDEEGAFMQAIFSAATGLLSDGLEWKTLRVLDPDQTEQVAKQARRQTQ